MDTLNFHRHDTFFSIPYDMPEFHKKNLGGTKENLSREAAFFHILKEKAIKTVFQPIISLRTGKILGHEALSRVTIPSPFKNIEEFIKFAAQKKQLMNTELLMLSVAMDTIFNRSDTTYHKLLFLNIDPNVLCEEEFIAKFKENYDTNLPNKQINIALELAERHLVFDNERFYEALSYFKKQLFRIAIDDLGMGSNGLSLISDISPNFIKLDMKLVQDIDKDKLKSAVIRGMVDITKATDIKLIAEGIETPEELEMLIELGVQYGQGYYLQKPDAEIHPVNEDIKHLIKSVNSKKNAINNYTIANTYIKHLVKKEDTIPPTAKVAEVSEAFNAKQDAFGVCITENNIPLGIITRENLALVNGGEFGFSLYNKKPISKVMDTDFLKVDCKQSVHDVSALAMDRESSKLYDFVVVTHNNQYYGVVTIKDLLLKSTELEVSSARHQNPLTGLPGNVIIEQKMDETLKNFEDYTIAYIDIDNFKAFNDVYGFEKGDRIIQLVAQILSTNFYGHFVGHVGGDDFVVILNSSVNEQAFEKSIREFEDRASACYSEADREAGYILTENRQGEPDIFPLVSITCATANHGEADTNNPDDFAKYLADKKSEMKKEKRDRTLERLKHVKIDLNKKAHVDAA